MVRFHRGVGDRDCRSSRWSRLLLLKRVPPRTYVHPLSLRRPDRSLLGKLMDPRTGNLHPTRNHDHPPALLNHLSRRVALRGVHHSAVPHGSSVDRRRHPRVSRDKPLSLSLRLRRRSVHPMPFARGHDHALTVLSDHDHRNPRLSLHVLNLLCVSLLVVWVLLGRPRLYAWPQHARHVVVHCSQRREEEGRRRKGKERRGKVKEEEGRKGIKHFTSLGRRNQIRAGIILSVRDGRVVSSG